MTRYSLRAVAAGLALAALTLSGVASATEPAPPPEAPEAAPSGITNPFTLSGYFWVDTGYMARENAREGQYDQDASYMQGRFVFAAEYLDSFGALYAKARTEFIGFVNEFTKSQFEAHALDSYVQIGTDLFDVQIGRFLAWEVYHRGQGIELFTAEEAGALGGPALYWLNLTRGYRNESGQAALHFYPTDFLKFEVAGVYGQEQSQNLYGVRPVVDFTLDGFTLLAGFEYFTQQPQTTADKVAVTSKGFAAKLQYALPFLTIGANFAMGDTEYIDIQGLVDGEKTFDKISVGGFADIDFADSSIGLGYHLTTEENKQGEEHMHHQAFVSYLHRLPVEGLSLKAVYGFANAHIEDIDTDSDWENMMHSVRLRVAYEFQ